MGKETKITQIVESTPVKSSRYEDNSNLNSFIRLDMKNNQTFEQIRDKNVMEMLKTAVNERVFVRYKNGHRLPVQNQNKYQEIEFFFVPEECESFFNEASNKDLVEINEFVLSCFNKKV